MGVLASIVIVGGMFVEVGGMGVLVVAIVGIFVEFDFGVVGICDGPLTGILQEERKMKSSPQ